MSFLLIQKSPESLRALTVWLLIHNPKLSVDTKVNCSIANYRALSYPSILKPTTSPERTLLGSWRLADFSPGSAIVLSSFPTLFHCSLLSLPPPHSHHSPWFQGQVPESILMSKKLIVVCFLIYLFSNQGRNKPNRIIITTTHAFQADEATFTALLSEDELRRFYCCQTTIMLSIMKLKYRTYLSFTVTDNVIKRKASY